MTRRIFRTLTIAAAIACAWPGQPVSAQQTSRSSTEKPLTGTAWSLANQGYAAYEKGDYAKAQARARAALRLRPDSTRLQLLLIYSLQKQGKLEDADRAAVQAIASGADAQAMQEAQRNLKPAGATAGGPNDTAAYRKGFPVATEAYAAYNRGDYTAAASGAQQAFTFDPSQGPWALLWLDSLEAQGQLEAADQAAVAALAGGAPNTDDLNARRQSLHRRMAVIPAEKGYQALIANRPADAVPWAREAVRLAPDVPSHRLMLMTALFLDNQLKAAEDVASAGIERDNEDTTALAMRGYLRQRQGKTGPANADFDEAMAQDWLDDDQRRNVRLIAVDAALAAGERARATQLLAPLDGNDEAVSRRRKQALSAERPPATLTLSNYPPPAQDCHDTPYGTLCELLPFDAAVGGGPSALAYAAFARHDYQEAIVQAGKAVEQDPGSADKQRLLTTVLASGTDAQAAQASQRLQQAMVATPNDPDLLMQNGYLQQRLGHPDLALQSFEAARATGKAPATSILDLAYAQSAAGDKRAAVQSLKSAIDQADAGTLDLDPQRRFDTRSAVSGLSREWGGYVSAGYRGARPATTGLAGTTPSIPGDAVSNTAEIFWRPANFGNSATRVLEAYGRLSNTLYDSGSTTRAQDIADPCSANSTVKVAGTTSGSVAGVPSTVGSLGVRFTPSTTAGLTFGIERQFLLGTATRTGSLSPSDQNLRCSLNGSNKSAQYKADAGSGGWLTYVTYGFYEGSGYRLDTPSWFTMTGYAQAGYSWQDLPAHFWLQDNTTQARSGDVSGTLKRNQAFAASEVRAGRSYRMDVIDEHLVLFPHFVVAADWLSQRNSASAAVLGGTGNVSLQGNGSSWSLGAGPGVNMRYWFREDHYNAQRSYVDLTVQYRVNIGGGDASRAKGLFMSLTLSY